VPENNETTAAEPVWAVDLASVPWTAYEDEHLPNGDRAAQLKIVKPNLFYAKFSPGFTAPVHSHPFATTYYVTQGRIRFGDEGWISVGQFRGVHAGRLRPRGSRPGTRLRVHPLVDRADLGRLGLLASILRRSDVLA
jgi:hypothetical protein